MDFCDLARVLGKSGCRSQSTPQVMYRPTLGALRLTKVATGIAIPCTAKIRSDAIPPCWSLYCMRAPPIPQLELLHPPRLHVPRFIFRRDFWARVVIPRRGRGHASQQSVIATVGSHGRRLSKRLQDLL